MKEPMWNMPVPPDIDLQKYREIEGEEMSDYFPEKCLIGITPEFRKSLNEIRKAFGKPLHPTSGYRSPDKNTAAGGVKGSYHTKGRAADFSWREFSAKDKADLLLKILATGYLHVGIYDKHLHIDDSKYGVYFGGESK